VNPTQQIPDNYKNPVFSVSYLDKKSYTKPKIMKGKIQSALLGIFPGNIT
jgi:hypothetical protein